MLLWDMGTGDLNVEVISIVIINDFRATGCMNSLGVQHRGEKKSPKTKSSGDSSPPGRRHNIRS